MARRRTRVSKIRQIITYSMTTTMSERQIARALSVSRTVVAKTMRAFGACGLQYEGTAELPGFWRLWSAGRRRRTARVTSSWPPGFPAWCWS